MTNSIEQMDFNLSRIIQYIEFQVINFENNEEKGK